MTSSPIPGALRDYSAALVAVLVAYAITSVTWPLFQPTPMVLFYAAVVAGSWFGGVRAGVLAVVLSALVVNVAFYPPYGTFTFDGGQIGIVSAFLLVASAIVGLIASRQRAASNEREQRRWLAATLSSVGDAVIATDTDGRISFMNDIAERLTGWPAGDAAGRSLDEVFAIFKEGTRERSQSPVARALETGQVVGLADHTVLVARDGSEVPIEDSAAPIKDDDGGVRGMILVFRDAGEKRKARAVAEEARRQMTNVLESISDAYVAFDEDWRITYANAMTERLTGYSRDRLVGSNHWELFPAAVGTPVEDAYRRAAAGETSEFEVHYEPWGRWFAGRASPAREGGVVAYFREITDRVLAEQEQLRLGERVRLALDSAQLGSWNIEPETFTLQTDERFGVIFNGTAGPLSYEQAIAIIHEDDRDRIRELVARAIRPEGPDDYSAEHRVVHPDGSVRWVYARGRANFTGEGPARRLARFDGTIADITDRKRAEEVRERLLREVEAERARLSDVFQRAPSFMAVLRGPDHVYERVNDRCYELVGRRDLIGRPVREALPELEGQGFYELLDRVYRTGEPYIGADIPAHFERTPGAPAERRSIEFVFEPLRDADGVITGVLAQGIDLTERKLAEERLRESEERYRTLFTSIDEGFCVIEMLYGPDGKADDYRLVEVNPAFEKQTGLADATGRTVREMAPGHEAYWYELYGRVAETGEPVRFENHARAIGDRWFDVYAFRIDEPERRRVAVLFNDTTARKRLERSLRERVAELAEVDRKKDEFLAMLAHELRNPLAAINNAVTLTSRSGVRENVEWSMDVIGRQVKHLTHLIDDLLDVSRINQGKIELRREVVDLTPLLDHAAATSMPLIERRGHTLEVSIDRGNLRVEADPTRLEQVVMNLLNNAAKYSDDGGRIRLSASIEGDDVAISVKDRGVGIPPEKLPQMFELFAQGDRSLARSEGGLGIGLTVVKKLVELHGGTVDARSDGPGHGSEFTIRLPRAARPAAPLPAPKPPAPTDRAPARILVIDDSVDTARGMSRLLTLLGHQVEVAHGGPEGIELARSLRPEFILLDIGLPGMDGYQVAESLRREDCGKHSVIIAISGYGQDEDRRRSKQAGFDHHLIKPIDHDALLALLAAGRNGH